MFALTTGSRRHDAPAFEKDDVFVFGRKAGDCPEALVAGSPLRRDQRLRLPMLPERRSVNLSNDGSRVMFLRTAWRQQGNSAGGR